MPLSLYAGLSRHLGQYWRCIARSPFQTFCRFWPPDRAAAGPSFICCRD